MLFLKILIDGIYYYLNPADITYLAEQYDGDRVFCELKFKEQLYAVKNPNLFEITGFYSSCGDFLEKNTYKLDSKAKLSTFNVTIKK